MKRGKTLLAAFSLIAFAGAPAFANESGAKEAFSKLDADAKSRFEGLDRNRDPKLIREEYQAWASAASAGDSKAAPERARKARITSSFARAK